MKKLFYLTPVVAFFLCSCASTNKTASANNQSNTKGGQIVPWTKALQEKTEFTVELADIDFLNSEDISLSGDYFSFGATVENGTVVISDTAESHSRIFKRMSVGKQTGNTNMDPGETPTTLEVSFKKGNALSYAFHFDLTSDGFYVLNSDATINVAGNEYHIKTSGTCKLLCRLRHKRKVIVDRQ